MKDVIKPRPSVSVIIAVRNMQSTIGRCLDSIIRQDYPDIEIVVIDGASEDHTPWVLDHYKNQIATLVTEPDLGPYDALNKGLNLAKGSIISILNADDYFAHDHVIGQYVDVFDNSEAGIVYADIEFFNARNVRQTLRGYSSADFTLSDFRYGYMPPHPSVMVRREVYEKVGGFSTEYNFAADFDFLMRALWCHRIPKQRIDDTVVRMQLGGRSTRSVWSNLRLNREVLQVCEHYDVKSGWRHIAYKWFKKSREVAPLFSIYRPRMNTENMFVQPVVARR